MSDDLVLTINNGIKRIRSNGGAVAQKSFISMRTDPATAVAESSSLVPVSTPLVQDLDVPSEDASMEPSSTGVRILKPGFYLVIIDYQWQVADPSEGVGVGGSGFSPPFASDQPFEPTFGQGQIGSYSTVFRAPFSTLLGPPGASQPVPFNVNVFVKQLAGGPQAFGALLSVIEI